MSKCKKGTVVSTKWRYTGSGGTAPRHQVTESGQLHNPTALRWGWDTAYWTGISFRIIWIV